MKKTILISLLFCLAMFLAAEAQIEYLEGTLEVQNGSSWKQLEIGDIFADSALLRLGKSSLAQIKNNGKKITLSEAGSYTLSKLQPGKTHRVNVFSMISKLEKNQHYNTAVMGVRGASQEEKKGLDWIDGTDTKLIMEEAKQLLSSGKDAEAEKKFREVLAYDSEDSEANYYLAMIACLKNDLPAALKLLEKGAPEQSSENYIDFFILKANLENQCFAFNKALQTISKYTKAADLPEKKQLLLYLKATAQYNLKQNKEALESLAELQKIDSKSQLSLEADNLKTQIQSN